MNAHITDEEQKKMRAKKQVQEQALKLLKQQRVQAFIAGAHSVSRILMNDYVPPLEEAVQNGDTEKALRKLESIKKYLSNGDNLIQTIEENKNGEISNEES